MFHLTLVMGLGKGCCGKAGKWVDRPSQTQRELCPHLNTGKHPLPSPLPSHLCFKLSEVIPSNPRPRRSGGRIHRSPSVCPLVAHPRTWKGPCREPASGREGGGQVRVEGTPVNCKPTWSPSPPHAGKDVAFQKGAALESALPPPAPSQFSPPHTKERREVTAPRLLCACRVQGPGQGLPPSGSAVHRVPPDGALRRSPSQGKVVACSSGTRSKLWCPTQLSINTVHSLSGDQLISPRVHTCTSQNRQGGMS